MEWWQPALGEWQVSTGSWQPLSADGKTHRLGGKSMWNYYRTRWRDGKRCRSAATGEVSVATGDGGVASRLVINTGDYSGWNSTIVRGKREIEKMGTPALPDITFATLGQNEAYWNFNEF